MLPDVLRRIFRFINRYFMVPMFRLGLGAFIGNPVTGYIMVLKTRGRKSGLPRYAPVNYAILNGGVYCLAGWGRASDWYRNLVANPQIELILPGGTFTGRAETVADVDEKRIAMRQVLKNGGFAGYLEGFNPYAITEEELAAKAAEAVLVRVQLNGLGSGAADPGGWLWMLVWGGSLLALLLGSRRSRR